MHTVLMLGAVLMFPVGCLVLLLLLDRLESGLVTEVQKDLRRTVPVPVTAIPVRGPVPPGFGMSTGTTDVAARTATGTTRTTSPAPASIRTPVAEPVELPAVS